MTRFYSFIVPVYNRPDELSELLSFLAKVRPGSFEVVIIEDGSDVRSEDVVAEYRDKLDIRYIILPRSGPSRARNAGMEAARGDYLIFIDSDCLVPSDYLSKIDAHLDRHPLDFFGGPDRASEDFNGIQQAISYAMTSYLTTGGLRGGRKQVVRFHPRSFNMGISRAAYQIIGGFPDTRMHPGEDMVFSIELIRRGVSTGLIPDAFVYHKRRTSFRKFYRQVYGFGKTRYIISRVYPDTFRMPYLFPSIFIAGVTALILLSALVSWLCILPFLGYLVLIGFDALIRLHHPVVALQSVWASCIQLSGYGIGFLSAWFRGGVLRRDEYGVFQKGFYPDQS